jgi:hypothetical protein
MPHPESSNYMQDPSRWREPDNLPDPVKVLWQRCLSLFIARGILQPRHELWLEIFCHTLGQLDYVRASLATLPRRAGRAEIEHEERRLTELVVEQLSLLGFESELEFRQSLRGPSPVDEPLFFSSPLPDGNSLPHCLHLNLSQSGRSRSAAPCSNPQCGQRQKRIGML